MPTKKKPEPWRSKFSNRLCECSHGEYVHRLGKCRVAWGCDCPEFREVIYRRPVLSSDLEARVAARVKSKKVPM